MATTKVKRSVHKKQFVLNPEPSAKSPKTRQKLHSLSAAEQRDRIRSSSKKITHFSEARGKIVEDVEFFVDADSNILSLRFKDNTSLSFDFATGFATEAYFSRWKAGNERVLRYWPRILCEPTF